MSREGKDLSPGVSTGRRRRTLATPEEEGLLWEQLEENDDATLKRHCELWEQKTSVRVSISAMSWAIRVKLGWSYKKKTLGATEQDEEARSAFRKRLKGVDAECLLFVNESSTNVALTRRYGRAPRGERTSCLSVPLGLIVKMKMRVRLVRVSWWKTIL